MPIYTGIGFSQNPDPLAAAQEAAAQAREQLKNPRIDLAIVLNTVHYEPQKFLPIVFSELEQTKLIGSSTAGILVADRFERKGLFVAAISSEKIKFETGFISHLHLQDMRAAGKALAKNCVTDFDQQQRKLFFFFVDGLRPNVTGLVEGAKEFFGNSLPLVGAGSSDNFRFARTYQYSQTEIMSPGVSAVLLGGQFNMGMACQHGWKPLGKPRIIDQAQGNIIKLINGKKAVSIYEEYFGTEAASLKDWRMGQINLRYPLGLLLPDEKEYLLRNVVSTLDDGSIVCQDNVTEGTEVHIMIGNKDSCLLAAEQAATKVKDQLAGVSPKLIIVMSSLLRHKLLGRTANQEIQAIRNVLGYAPPLIGLYSASETFSTKPLGSAAKTYTQEGSISILALN